MYKLDTNAAKAADSTGSRITETGKYKGHFTRAEHIEARNTKTKGIDFDFVSDGGQKARFAIYTVKADGTTIYGYKQLMAMLTVLSLRSIANPVDTVSRVYDFDAREEVNKSSPQFVELLNKPIGLLLAMEEYEPGKLRPTLSGVFQADTELVASEILERKSQPQTLAKMVALLRDKPLRGSAPAGHTQAADPSTGGLADLESDIPF